MYQTIAFSSQVHVSFCDLPTPFLAVVGVLPFLVGVDVLPFIVSVDVLVALF